MKKQTHGNARVFVMGIFLLMIIFSLLDCNGIRHNTYPALSPTLISSRSTITVTPHMANNTTEPPTIRSRYTSTSTPTLAPIYTSTLTPTHISGKIPTLAAACSLANPIVTAPLLWGASASPDGQWVAYFAASREAIAQTVDKWPTGIFNFINLRTGKACMRAEITSDAIKPNLAWSEDGRVTIVTKTGTYNGLPCQPEPFAQVSQQTTEDLVSATSKMSPDYSPDGKYQIKTVELSIKNDIPKYETSIITVDSGKVVQSVTWFIDAREGSGNFTGGEWISRSQFLIFETTDRGPMILDANKGVIQVVTDLLGMQAPKSLLNGGLFTIQAIPLPGSEPDQYHLLVLGGSGDPSDFPDAILYHAENGISETFPYKIPWYGGFSPDHQWLMMDKQPDMNGHEAHEVWIRPLEDTHAAWQLLGGPNEIEYGALWNATNTEIVINHEDRITWQTFPNPNHERLGCWSTASYWANPEFLSKDGCFVLATGNRPGVQDSALFILHPARRSPNLPPHPPEHKSSQPLQTPRPLPDSHYWRQPMFQRGCL